MTFRPAAAGSRVREAIGLKHLLDGFGGVFHFHAMQRQSFRN